MACLCGNCCSGQRELLHLWSTLSCNLVFISCRFKGCACFPLSTQSAARRHFCSGEIAGCVSNRWFHRGVSPRRGILDGLLGRNYRAGASCHCNHFLSHFRRLRTLILNTFALAGEQQTVMDPILDAAHRSIVVTEPVNRYLL